MFSDDRLNKEISAEIDALEARDDASSSELLASLALSHFAHGPLEDRAFRILGDRRDVARLLRIYSHARSHCTIGGCLRQLVRLRAGGVYEKLCATLSQDGGMFPIGVVSLLVELNDPRTPEPLIAYTEDRNAPFFEDALVALGHFDTAEARRHLERWVKDEEVAPFAAAGLYRMTEDQKWLQLVVRFMEKADTFEVWPIVASIRSIGTADAKQLVAQFDAREAEEERARSERDQGKQ